MEKKFSIAEVSIKYKKWFVLARKSISTTRNEAFLEKYYTENQRKWFPLAGKCFLLKLVPPNFNNGFQQQKRKL